MKVAAMAFAVYLLPVISIFIYERRKLLAIGSKICGNITVSLANKHPQLQRHSLL